MKKFIHPKWFKKVPIIYEGKIIGYTESTCKDLIVKTCYWKYYSTQNQEVIHSTHKQPFNIKYTTILF